MPRADCTESIWERALLPRESERAPQRQWHLNEALEDGQKGMRESPLKEDTILTFSHARVAPAKALVLDVSVKDALN